MAIKISGTEVINDSLKLKSITDATGFFTGFHAVPVAITDNVNFTTPMHTCTLTAATTFTESGMAAGRSAIVLLDTSTNYYTPTFPSSWNWPDNTEPTWGDYQHWQVYATCVSATEIRANAVGFTATGGGAPTETVSLSGTTSSPETFFDRATSNNNDMIMGWEFDANGNIYKYESIYNVGGAGRYLHSSAQWNNITPSTTYYIRASSYSGFTPSTSPSSDSAALNTWHALSSTRKWWFRDSRDLLTYGAAEGTIKIEIASDSGGSNILDTGYYQCTWTGLA